MCIFSYEIAKFFRYVPCYIIKHTIYFVHLAPKKSSHNSAMLKAVILLACIVMGLGPTLTRARCGTYWTEFGGSCYRNFGIEKTWMAAERHCRNIKSNLTSVHSEAENTFLYNYWRSSIRTPSKVRNTTVSLFSHSHGLFGEYNCKPGPQSCRSILWPT